MDRALILSSVCRLITEDRIDSAKETLLRDYPRYGVSTTRTSWPIKRLVEIYVRDGFTDRYFGNRLVFPGTLRALSVLLGDSFPYHRNWKQSSTHPGFYELYPTIDHVIPVARGGPDDESNVVTTSMLHNSSKANWLIGELNWPAERAPIVTGWDGLLGWFMTAWEAHEVLRRDQALSIWQRAARACLGRSRRRVGL